MPKKYLNKILNARVYDIARESPLEEAAKLSARLADTRETLTDRASASVAASAAVDIRTMMSKTLSRVAPRS